jgi:hypothetical protein
MASRALILAKKRMQRLNVELVAAQDALYEATRNLEDLSAENRGLELHAESVTSDKKALKDANDRLTFQGDEHAERIIQLENDARLVRRLLEIASQTAGRLT